MFELFFEIIENREIRDDQKELIVWNVIKSSFDVMKQLFILAYGILLPLCDNLDFL